MLLWILTSLAVYMLIGMGVFAVLFFKNESFRSELKWMLLPPADLDALWMTVGVTALWPVTVYVALASFNTQE